MPGQPYSLFQQRNTKATSVGTSENPQAGTTSQKEDAGTANKGAPSKFTFLPLLPPPTDEAIAFKSQIQDFLLEQDCKIISDEWGTK